MARRDLNPSQRGDITCKFLLFVLRLGVFFFLCNFSTVSVASMNIGRIMNDGNSGTAFVPTICTVCVPRVTLKQRHVRFSFSITLTGTGELPTRTCHCALVTHSNAFGIVTLQKAKGSACAYAAELSVWKLAVGG